MNQGRPSRPPSVAISRNRPQSAAICRNQPQSAAIGRNQPQSAAIGRNQPQSVVLGRTPTHSHLAHIEQHARRIAKGSPVQGPQVLVCMGCEDDWNAPEGERVDLRLAVVPTSEAVRGNQRQSETIIGNHRQSESISRAPATCDGPQSPAVRGRRRTRASIEGHRQVRYPFDSGTRADKSCCRAAGNASRAASVGATPLGILQWSRHSS